MENREDLHEGDKVHCTAPFGKKTNGIVKSFSGRENFAFVVYNCNQDWENYKDYSGQSTNLDDITLGWIESPQN